MKSADTLLREKIERLREGVEEVREAMAAELFALDGVIEAMAKATAQGLRWVRIQAPRPVDLSGTRAAKETTAMLKKAGAEIEWLPRLNDPTLNERVVDLLVRW
jgi:precorrin-4 methylase